MLNKLNLKIVVLLAAMVFPMAAGAQQVLAGSQTGTIQQLEQSDGYLVISGRRYDFDSEITQITMQGEEFDDADFEPGMVVRFTVRDNMLMQIQVLGPFTAVEDLAVH